MKIYRTKQGDMWDALSRTFYGSEFYMHELIQANYEHRDIVIFPAGILLNIPEIETAVDVLEESLPPWKRGE